MKCRQNMFFVVILCLIFVFDSTTYSNVAYAAGSSDYIRVGLVSTYSGQSTIKIYNTSVTMGYSSGNSYSSDATLNSTTGFSFSADSLYYYVSDNTFSNLTSAFSAAAVFVSAGYTAYPAALSRGNYKIYVGGYSSEGGLSSILSSINNTYGYTFSALAGPDSMRIKMEYDEGTVIIDGNSSGSYPQFGASYGNESGAYVVDLGDRKYRGRIEIGRYGSSYLTAVSVVRLEEYLYGVVPCEMVSSWNIEALKAQAVCARSYAYLTAGYGSDTIREKGYNMVDTTASQVYKGYLSETDNTNKAVDLTKGEMIYYNGNPVKGYYFSTSGGSTENIEDVWNTPVAYLRSVSDTYELFPEKKPWIISVTASEISSKLQENGINVGKISNINIDVLTSSKHAYSVKFTGSSGKKSISGDKVRTYLGLPSTRFKIVKYGDNPDKVYAITSDKSKETELENAYVINGDGEVSTISSDLEQVMVLSKDNITGFATVTPQNADTYYLVGQGSGHSVGMSQCGARGMADAGYSYTEILTHYYTGVTVK